MRNNILKRIWVLQEVSNKNRLPTLGKGFSIARRFNPYNPLSYIVIIKIRLNGINHEPRQRHDNT